jgi:hypothetical protein
MTYCLKCGKVFRHYTIYFKPDPMYTKMYQFIPIVMCAWCRNELAERQKILKLEYNLFSEFN